MAITTLDGLIGAAHQKITFVKLSPRTSIAALPFSLFDIGGNPGNGVLAGTSTTAGVVPTDATAGCPRINNFSGLDGYITGVQFGSTVTCRIRLYDMLFKAGAYAFNANTALTGQPSFLGRIPGGTAADCAGQTEIWVETVTAATGNQTWNVTYTNEAGVTGRTTGAIGIGSAPSIGRLWQLPLAAGDKGVSQITNVQGGTGTAGTANILVLRPLWTGRVIAANSGDIHDYLRVGMPRIFEDSALVMMVSADSTSTGIPELNISVSVG